MTIAYVIAGLVILVYIIRLLMKFVHLITGGDI